MKKTYLCLILLLSTFSAVFIGCSKSYETERTMEELVMDCVTVEEGNAVITSSDSGFTEVTVTMPNYKKIFLECDDYRKLEEYITDVLLSGKYPVSEYNETAEVIVKDGIQTIETDEIVRYLLEEELIDAVNAISEEEQ